VPSRSGRWHSGLALYLVTSVLAGLAGKVPLKWYLGWLLPSLAAAVLLAVLGHDLPAWLLAVLAVVALAWFASYNLLVTRLETPGAQFRESGNGVQ
jgi:Flp pilus assembly protein TadB